MAEKILAAALVPTWVACATGFATWVAIHEGVRVLTGRA